MKFFGMFGEYFFGRIVTVSPWLNNVTAGDKVPETFLKATPKYLSFKKNEIVEAGKLIKHPTSSF
jgi:hypothetical protein